MAVVWQSLLLPLHSVSLYVISVLGVQCLVFFSCSFHCYSSSSSFSCSSSVLSATMGVPSRTYCLHINPTGFSRTTGRVSASREILGSMTSCLMQIVVVYLWSSHLFQYMSATNSNNICQSVRYLFLWCRSLVLWWPNPLPQRFLNRRLHLSLACIWTASRPRAPFMPRCHPDVERWTWYGLKSLWCGRSTLVVLSPVDQQCYGHFNYCYYWFSHSM